MILALRPYTWARKADNSAMSEHTSSDVLSALLPSGSADLNAWALVRASGADALSFLQGQLTHDLALLPEDQLRLNAYCSPQGRMLANLLTWREGPQDVMLLMPSALLEPTLKRLRMFVMRAKCQLDAVSEAKISGHWGDAVPNTLTSAGQLWRHSDGHSTWLRLSDGHGGVARALCVGEHAPVAHGSEADWEAHAIAAGAAWLTPETSGAFVPQMLNWESLDGISFKKGCYPGQEVVARSQFRGAIKRRTERVACAVPLKAGDAVFTAQGEVGTVVNAAPLGQAHVALVCVHVGEAQGQVLHAGSSEGAPLSRLGLPYTLRDDI